MQRSDYSEFQELWYCDEGDDVTYWLLDVMWMRSETDVSIVVSNPDSMSITIACLLLLDFFIDKEIVLVCLQCKVTLLLHLGLSTVQ